MCLGPHLHLSRLVESSIGVSLHLVKDTVLEHLFLDGQRKTDRVLAF